MDRCFAYGSNLNLRDLELWCQRLGRPPALMVRPGVPAYLPDHEVVFDYLSSSRKGGVLDLRPSVGKIVPGALFEVTEEDLRTLDLKEGVPLIYRRVEKRVLLADGREVMARAYEVSPEYRLPAPVAPAPAYVEIVAAGLAAFGHDDAHAAGGGAGRADAVPGDRPLRLRHAAARRQPARGVRALRRRGRRSSRPRPRASSSTAAPSPGCSPARRGPFTANWSDCATCPSR